MTAAENPWLKMALSNAWANATLYRALSRLSDAKFTATRPGFFPSLVATMNHIYRADLYYLDALEGGGRGRAVYECEDVDSARKLAGLQAAADRRFAQFCRDVKAEGLAGACVTDRKAGPVRENVAALILHLVQHQIHHRGQAHVQLSDAGVAPPQLDDFYLEFGRVPSAAAYW